MTAPTFGIFDHIEDIPGTPTHQLFKDRLDLIKQADDAGFAGFHLAEHHGSDLCMAPNQEVFDVLLPSICRYDAAIFHLRADKSSSAAST